MTRQQFMVALSRRRLRRALMLVPAVALLAAGLAWALLFADLPPVRAVEERSVRPTSRILDRNGRLLYEVIDPQAGKQLSLAIDTLPQACIDATLATEDQRFYQHPGVDVIAIGRALWQNLRARGDIVSGGSTITQQVARTLLLEPEERYIQSVRRKLREAYLALKLEARYSKDEILALYLNQTYYGHFAFGMEAAAQIFFAKPAAQLARGECALLAGLVQYPTGYDPLAQPEVAKARQQTVLRLMREAGFVSADEQQQIAAEPLRYKTQLFHIQAPHFVVYVLDLLGQRQATDALRRGGLTVQTTLDLDLQRAAEASVRHRLDLLNCKIPGACTPTTNPNRRVDNAAVVVLDSRSGDILAMVGSPNYFDLRTQGNVNAALSLRQPGSAIKPFTYAAALDRDWSAAAGVEPLTPASILADLPTVFYVEDATAGKVPYVPMNYDRKAHGPVSVREALANSFNVPAVQVLDRLGVTTLKRIAAQAGITTFTRDFGLALTLGGGEVRLLELTAAYGTLDDGRRLDPQAILAVRDGATGQETSWTRPAGAGPQVIAPQTAWLLTDILDDDVARLPAFGGNSVLALPFPAAAKTGTTTDWRDNWTLGYSTERVVGVWVGNADNSPMLDVSGIDGAGPIWRDVMLAAHDAAPAPFVRPAGIVDATVCAPSGMLATATCPRTRVEHFLAGTEPTMADTQFQTVAVDRVTGLRATSDTPRERTVERVYWLLPPQYHDWMVAQGIARAPRTVAVPSSVSGESVRNGEQAGAPANTGVPNAGALLLDAPTSNTAYRLHPGLPQASQRIQVGGYVQDGAAWSALRIVAEGPQGTRVVADAVDASRVAAWWAIEPGTWRFRLEGRRTPDAATEQSDAAVVVVEEMATATAQSAARP